MIGAGVHGGCVAYALAQRGLRPVVIERGYPGEGASGRNGGLGVAGPADGYASLRTRWGAERARTIMGHTVAGLDHLQALLLEEALDVDLRPGGHLVLALTEAEHAALVTEAEARQADGFQAEVIARQALAEVLGLQPTEQALGGVLLSPGLQVHSGRLVAGLADTAQRLGARLCPGVTVTGLVADAHTIRVHTDQGVLEAGCVVVCANA